jgi:type I restriction enzyme M protein
MALKKSDLYSSLWTSCDELRGGMDASQYKGLRPVHASFTDIVALKGKPDIGNRINTQIIQPLIDANSRLARSDFPDSNDPNKLGEGQAMVERLSNLIGIFQKPELDFSQNRAEHPIAFHFPVNDHQPTVLPVPVLTEENRAPFVMLPTSHS